MPRLILNPGTPQAQDLVLNQGTNNVGRGEHNDFAIGDPSVSGSHCQFIVSEGAVQLRDLGSTNGTFVNGTRVTEANLEAGQRVRLGGVDLVFEADGQHTSAPAKPASGPIRVKVAAPSPGPLRISGISNQPPPPVAAEEEAEAAPPDIAVPISAPANTRCKYHPRTIARWVCVNCRNTYCDLCVADRHGGAVHQKFCRSCGAIAAPLSVAFEAPEEKTFFRELPKAFAYPFRGSGPLVLIFATLLFAALEFLSFGIFGLLIKIVAIGYLFSFMQAIIQSTAAGDENMPEMPGMDDLFSGCGRMIGTILMSFGPALVLAYFAIAQEQPTAGIAMIPAIIFGAFYMPMAFLAVAMKDNVMASNPLVVIPSILRVPLEYLVTAVLAVGLFGLRWLGDLVTGMMAGPFDAETMGGLFASMAARAVWALVSVYLLTVTVRILGLLYLTKRDRLGW